MTYSTMVTVYICVQYTVKGKVFYGQKSPRGESTTTHCEVNYQLLAVMLLKYHNGEILVAVNRNQVWTMASETIDPIDWLLQSPSWEVPLSASHTVAIGTASARN